MLTELHCILVGGIDYWHGAIVMCGMPAMAGSVTVAQSHYEGAWKKCNKRSGECNGNAEQ